MRITEVRADGTGTADLDGAAHEVALTLVAGAAVGDYVIVHAGYAIEKLDRREADERLALFKELAEAWQADTDAPGPGAAPR